MRIYNPVASHEATADRQKFEKPLNRAKFKRRKRRLAREGVTVVTFGLFVGDTDTGERQTVERREIWRQNKALREEFISSLDENEHAKMREWRVIE